MAHGGRGIGWVVVGMALVGAPGCGDGSTAGGAGAGGPGGSGSSGAGASGAAGTACHEYAPGESGGEDYAPLLTKSQIESLDLGIEYPDAPIAAIDASSAYLDDLGLVRVTMTGLVKVDPDQQSTPFEFHDVPLTGLSASDFSVTLDGAPATARQVTCSGNPDTPITIVFLIDVTGSMSPVIDAVKGSLLDFVDTATALELGGRIGAITFQDTVGVDVPFEDCSGVTGPIPERSPFFAPVSLTSAPDVTALRDFIGGLHADRGNDLPENLAAAVDFAKNGVIGYTADGGPNVIGEGDDDPPFTRPWPVDQLEGLTVLIAITDASFHRPDTSSPYVSKAFRPRDLREILGTLGRTVVATIDPAVLDGKTAFEGQPEDPDADFWSRYTGGFGLDRHEVSYLGLTESVSYFDLELLLLGNGLLEIPLAPALAATCVLEVPAASAPGSVGVQVTRPEGTVSYSMEPSVVAY